MPYGVIGIQPHRLAKLFYCCISPSNLKKRFAEVDSCINESGLQLQRLFILWNCLVIPLLFGQYETNPGPWFGEVRINRDGRFIMFSGSVQLPLLGVIDAEIDIGQCVFSSNRQSVLE